MRGSKAETFGLLYKLWSCGPDLFFLLLFPCTPFIHQCFFDQLQRWITPVKIVSFICIVLKHRLRVASAEQGRTGSYFFSAAKKSKQKMPPLMRKLLKINSFH